MHNLRCKKTETINKLAHSYKQYVTPATTSADGSITKNAQLAAIRLQKAKYTK